MHLTLLVPGLLWPNQSTHDLTEGLALPALGRLLGLGQATLVAGESFEAALLRAWGAHTGQEHAAIGTLRRLGESPEDVVPATATSPALAYLCADPVYLQVTREHILLESLAPAALTLDEAHTLAATLNAFLAEHEPTLGALEVATSTRWYLPLLQPCTTAFHPLAAATGRPIARYLPQGDDARRWQQLGNELQMLLHSHPINAARTARGEKPVNALWLWGNGELPATLRAPAPHCFADHILVRGLAQHAGCPVAPRKELWSTPIAGAAWLLDDRLLGPALDLDLDAWRAALLAFETEICVPMLATLRTGSALKRLDLHAPGDRATLRATLGRYAHWAFWRTPRTLASLQQGAKPHEPALAPPPTPEKP